MGDDKKPVGRTTPKFIQLATGAWKQSGATTGFNHSVYGLSEDGDIFKYTKDGGWEKLDNPPAGSRTRQPNHPTKDNDW